MKTMLALALAIGVVYNAHALSFRGCTNSQKKTITAAHVNVKKRLGELLDVRTGIPFYNLRNIINEKVKPEKRIPSKRYTNHNQTYATFHSKLTSNLRKMQTKVNSGYTYQCSSASVRHCQGGGGVQAYVLFLFGRPYNKIHFCPLFFKSDMRDMEQTILHELSHLAANTEHYFGSIFNDQGLIKSTNDAYLYGRMMHWGVEGMMKVNSWGHIWVPDNRQ